MNGTVDRAVGGPVAAPSSPVCTPEAAPAAVPMAATAEAALPPSPWHAGEVAMQRLAGVAEKMDSVGRKVVRPYMPEQHRDFFAQLPFVVLGTVDGAGDVWATLRTGAPGFLHSPEPRVLDVRLPRMPDDPADAGMNDGGDIALLGIELHTRRRNRMNGVLRRGPDGTGHIDVLQSFGNCPQYIQLRDMQLTNDVPAPARWLPAPDEAAKRLVAHADSFYVASYAELPDGRRQVDVSHRGGLPGFMRVEADGALTVPEFAGNLFFNTLGNFTVNPRAGLVFVDFEHGHLLQMTGDVQLLESLPDGEVAGAQRYWRFTPRRVVWRRGALGLRWAAQPDGVSPAALRTGIWDGSSGGFRAAEAAVHALRCGQRRQRFQQDPGAERFHDDPRHLPFLQMRQLLARAIVGHDGNRHQRRRSAVAAAHLVQQRQVVRRAVIDGDDGAVEWALAQDLPGQRDAGRLMDFRQPQRTRRQRHGPPQHGLRLDQQHVAWLALFRHGALRWWWMTSVPA